MNSIGKIIAPFCVQAITGRSIHAVTEKELLGQYSVLFFYPLDFTFVCPTEINALQAAHEDFVARGAKVYAISVDSVHAHRAWLETPRARGGIAGASFTLISDMQRQLTSSLGVLNEDGVALRATFILDKEARVQHASVNNLSFGRNIAEIIRMIDAIQFVEQHGDSVCPANWQAGSATLKPDQASLEKYMTDN